MERLPSRRSRPEDPTSAKFRARISALVESLVATATSEIVAVFDKVVAETKAEISSGRREVEALRRQLEECAQVAFAARRDAELKSEEEEQLWGTAAAPGTPVKPESVEQIPEFDAMENGDLEPYSPAESPISRAGSVVFLSQTSPAPCPVPVLGPLVCLPQTSTGGAPPTRGSDHQQEDTIDTDLEILNGGDGLSDTGTEGAERQAVAMEEVSSASEPQPQSATNTLDLEQQNGDGARDADCVEQEVLLTEEAYGAPSPQSSFEYDPQVLSSGDSEEREGLDIKSEGEATVAEKQQHQNNFHAESDGAGSSHTLRSRQHLPKRCPCSSAAGEECSLQPGHLKKTHQGPDRPRVVQGLFKCGKCGKTFKKPGGLGRHKKREHDVVVLPKRGRGRPLKTEKSKLCQLCGERYSTPNAFANHQKPRNLLRRKCLYSCYICGQRFATDCCWTIHKRLHSTDKPRDPKPEGNLLTFTPRNLPTSSRRNLSTSSLKKITSQRSLPTSSQSNLPTSSSSQTGIKPEELRAKVQVHLQRIPDATLKAALANARRKSSAATHLTTALGRATDTPLPKTASLDSATGATYGPTATSLATTAMSEADADSMVVAMATPAAYEECSSSAPVVTMWLAKEGRWIPSAAIQLPECKEETSDDASYGGLQGGAEPGSDDGTAQRKKRRMSECTHDLYGGVFPIERIVKRRHSKGQDEVRVKWLPCSACGAKWKDTWEPAESFPSFPVDQ